MIFQKDLKFITVSKGNTAFNFLETGDIFEILSGNIMINMFNGTYKEGSLNNIYLRIYKEGKIKISPLLGIKSNSTISYNEYSIVFKGNAYNINYKVTLTISSNNIWFYNVDLYGENVEIDILYCQDVAIANKGAVLSNELYTSQYIDHKALEKQGSYVLCSRQNQDQNGKFPYLEQGCINMKIISYLTDGMQFFSKEYKETNTPYLINKDFPKENYQYELSYIGLQSEKTIINGHKNIIFYGLFKEDYKEPIKELKFDKEILNALNESEITKENYNEVNKISLKDEFTGTFVSEDFTIEEIKSIYNRRKFEEYDEHNNLLSFFTNKHTHVVLKQKEVYCERPHGNIIITGISKENLNSNVMSSTNYMYGVFNSQVVIDNTNLNKMLSVNRGLLNVLKNSGQRIYMKINGEFKLLTLPYIYEMGLNFSKWYYKINEDIVEIKVYSCFNSQKITLEVNSKNNIEYEFLISNQIVMGENEHNHNFNVVVNNHKIRITPEEGSFLKNTYSNIYYEFIFSNCQFTLLDDGVFFKDELVKDKSLLVFKLKSSKFNLSIVGSCNCNEYIEEHNVFNEENNKFNEFYKDLLNGFYLEDHNNSKYNVDKLNEIIYFYAHNAMIHFASPHGLEQSGGAAWGTRDVCQGPIELFLSTNNYNIVREIILKIYSNQFKETGEWPQWFMFDKYNMQQNDSHGDIVFWPIKVISDYVLITGDKSIFNEEVSYKSSIDFSITNKEKIIQHIEKAIESIKNRFMENTYLISYEGGDWDDTLQPVNNNLKQKLVSTWTMALAYESISKLYKVIPNEYLKKQLYEMYTGIERDFIRYAIKNKVISGFVYLNNNVEYIIHPLDLKTKINYRLLPLVRSIISELVDLKQAEINEHIIKEYLTFSDGVRLMDKTPIYSGGVSEIFKRAEQASNVGREISLQYVHAHIRYIESMCKLGKENIVWDSLFKINPILIKDNVSNAEYRQSNCYFSSSDGDFKTRYDFQNNFNKLEDKQVKVKGGWRIYSSGPGIFINQLISNILGIRELEDKIIFDPVIPKELNNLCFNYKILNKNVKITYKIRENKQLKNIILNEESLSINYEVNKYKNNIKSVNKTILKNKLKDSLNLITIEI